MIQSPPGEKKRNILQRKWWRTRRCISPSASKHTWGNFKKIGIPGVLYVFFVGSLCVDGAAVNLSRVNPRHLHLTYIICDLKNRSLATRNPFRSKQEKRWAGWAEVGWDGMLMFHGPCKPKMARKH